MYDIYFKLEALFGPLVSTIMTALWYAALIIGIVYCSFEQPRELTYVFY